MKVDVLALGMLTCIRKAFDLMRQSGERDIGDMAQIEGDDPAVFTALMRTAEDWLKHFDEHAGEIGKVLRDVYGADARLWTRRWRLFFLATAGLFGHAGGREWGVSHYRLAPTAR